MSEQLPVKRKRTKKLAPQRIEIVRDKNFCRFTLDQAAVLPLGRDLEIGCLQASPEITHFDDVGDSYQYEMKRPMIEVARVRLGWGEAVSLAMQILHVGIERDHFRADKIIEGIAKMKSEAEAAAAVGVSDAD